MLKPGDEVIIPDLTFVATANAVGYTSATPVLADIDTDTLCMDPASAKSLISARTCDCRANLSSRLTPNIALTLYVKIAKLPCE